MRLGNFHSFVTPPLFLVDQSYNVAYGRDTRDVDAGRRMKGLGSHRGKILLGRIPDISQVLSFTLIVPWATICWLGISCL